MIRIEVDSAALTATLHGLQQSACDLPMAAIGQAVRNDILDRFRTATAPDGTPWAALSAVTLARRCKGKGRGSAKPLLDTGVLRNSVQILELTDGSVTVGTRERYAATHQWGARQGQYGRSKRNSPTPWGNVPARPFVGLSQQGEAGVRETILDHLRRVVR